MPTRRQFLGRGLAAVAAGLMARHVRLPAAPFFPRVIPGGGDDPSDPVAPIPISPESVIYNGIPFAPWFTGDGFQASGENHIQIPPFMNALSEKDLPSPAESVSVAIVGGGISGLTSAYVLRKYHPVLFDIHERFGGAARGETWAGTSYSLGNAYVITPDPGTFLHKTYKNLGLHQVVRVSDPPDPVEIDGVFLDDFYSNGATGDPAELAALAEYAEVVAFMADEGYPDIPFAPGGGAYVTGLDQKSLKQDIQDRMQLPVPPLLESAIQGYCLSSFGAGWEEISAAGGWNFLAAEEYGRWVFPGGTSYLSRALWQELRDVENKKGGGPGSMLRAGAAVLDVRLKNSGVQVTYRDAQGELRSLLADRVVMACPKFVCHYIMPDLAALDSAKLVAMQSLRYRAYAVANVLLNRAVERDYYDVFLLGSSDSPLGSYDPCGAPLADDDTPITDVLNGEFARPTDLPRSVLTIYWPLPCPYSRYDLLFDNPLQRFAERFASQFDAVLDLFEMKHEDVVQVRLTRWGHAMPINEPNLIANGTIDHLRRPFEGLIHFVNQDNWALPAVENSMLDAEIVASQIQQELGMPSQGQS